jgi:hypothetical protein
MKMRRTAAFVLALALAACGGENTPPQEPVAGAERSAKSVALETGASLMQDRSPLSRLSTYLDGFHFASGEIHHQMEAHHYCAKLNEDVTQCVLYDGNVDEARLIGIEYVISRRLFEGLDQEERKLWHSHAYEVKSGQLIAPGIPDIAERELMEQLVSTYGKTWHMWEKGPVPVGIPQLMMGFTADGQLQPSLLAGRDQRFSVSTAQKREQRAGLAAPDPLPWADAWQQGEVRQLQIAPGRGASEATAAPQRPPARNELPAAGAVGP